MTRGTSSDSAPFSGVGKILAMTMLYEIHDINRFERVQNFASYARLVQCEKSSSGKRLDTGAAVNPTSNWSQSMDKTTTMPSCELCPLSIQPHRGYTPRQPPRVIGSPLAPRPITCRSRARVLPQLCPSPDPVSNELEVVTL